MKASNPHFPIKRLPDNRALINLGSSARVAPNWNNVDFSWIVRVGRHRRVSALLHKLGLINEARYTRILQMDPDTILWDLRKGIPFPDKTFDGVYHCHVLEHIDREAAPAFLGQCYRVLKPGGILRIVVPDLEQLARHYVDILNHLPDQTTMAEHTLAVEEMFDQMIIRTPIYRQEQNFVVRFLENILVGNTDQAGILHRWMYDRFSLEKLLQDIGFDTIQSHNEVTSQIVGWQKFNLDTEPDGRPYKPGSLYMEGRRPLNG